MEQRDKSVGKQEQVSQSAKAWPMKEANVVQKRVIGKMKTLSIVDGEDVKAFTKGMEVHDSWLTKSDADLEPVASLLSMGLKYAVKDYCEMIPKTYFSSYGIQPSLNNRLVVIIYRCTRELIDNAVQHGNPEKIWVQLTVDDDFLSVTVRDDGIGFDPDHVGIGKGLANISTCVEALDGRMIIHSTPGLETEISIEIEDPQKITDV
jgi:hypothetical protein